MFFYYSQERVHRSRSAQNLSNLLQKAKTNTKRSQPQKRGTLWLWDVSLCTQSSPPQSEIKLQHTGSTEIYRVLCMLLSCGKQKKTHREIITILLQEIKP